MKFFKFFILSIILFFPKLSNSESVCWIESSNIMYDNQILNKVLKKCNQIVIRADKKHEYKKYDYNHIIYRIKNQLPDTPVLLYSWATRLPEKGRIELDVLANEKFHDFLIKLNHPNRKNISYLNITNIETKYKIIKCLVEGVYQYNTDGIAIDTVIRTPTNIKQLEYKFLNNPELNDTYKKDLDSIFSAIKQNIGINKHLIYNGLFNFKNGQLADQIHLLKYADGAAIEFFGLNPNQKNYAFKNDIKPYLDIIEKIPTNKFVHVFARGPWEYTDYLFDYKWQRYLYASFLLVQRPGDLFKYHSSFQVPAHKGRSGGIDMYNDWNVQLGNPLGPYTIENGLYKREFERCSVIMAPDGGAGGRLNFKGIKYSIDGTRIANNLYIQPGESFFLFNDLKYIPRAPRNLTIDSSQVASWGWTRASLHKMKSQQYIRLDQPTEKMMGDHDLLLDHERSLTPFQSLEINAKLINAESSLLAVAEVDDQRHKHLWVVVKIDQSKNDHGKMRMTEAVRFRTHNKKENPQIWPMIHIQHSPDKNGKFILDGPSLFNNNRYTFRRWSHLRFEGSIELDKITLKNRTPHIF